MSNFLGRLFGTEKAINDLTDKDNGLLAKGGAWLGNLNYTEEEKAEANERRQEWAIRQLSALEPFKIVQRIIAFNAMSVWTLFGINLLVAVWYDVLNRCSASNLDCVEPNATAAMLAIIVTPFLAYPIIAVVSLYMSGGVFPEIFNRNKK
jgi:hypothetical protein